jgi:hypothetical protein
MCEALVGSWTCGANALWSRGGRPVCHWHMQIADGFIVGYFDGTAHDERSWVPLSANIFGRVHPDVKAAFDREVG